MCCNAPNMMIHCGVRPPRLHHSSAGRLHVQKFTQVSKLSAGRVHHTNRTSFKKRCAMFLILLLVRIYLSRDHLQIIFHRRELLDKSGLINCECAAVRRSFIINVVCLYISNSRVSSCRCLAIVSDPLRYVLCCTAALVWDRILVGIPFRLLCFQSLCLKALYVSEYRQFRKYLGGTSSLLHHERYRLSTVWCSWSLPSS